MTAEHPMHPITESARKMAAINPFILQPRLAAVEGCKSRSGNVRSIPAKLTRT